MMPEFSITVPVERDDRIYFTQEIMRDEYSQIAMRQTLRGERLFVRVEGVVYAIAAEDIALAVVRAVQERR